MAQTVHGYLTAGATYGGQGWPCIGAGCAASSGANVTQGEILEGRKKRRARRKMGREMLRLSATLQVRPRAWFEGFCFGGGRSIGGGRAESVSLDV